MIALVSGTAIFRPVCPPILGEGGTISFHRKSLFGNKRSEIMANLGCMDSSVRINEIDTLRFPPSGARCIDPVGSPEEYEYATDLIEAVCIDDRRYRRGLSQFTSFWVTGNVFLFSLSQESGKPNFVQSVKNLRTSAHIPTLYVRHTRPWRIGTDILGPERKVVQVFETIMSFLIRLSRSLDLEEHIRQLSNRRIMEGGYHVMAFGKHSDLIVFYEEKTGEKCPICLAGLDDDVSHVTRCRHAFHAKCLYEWKQQSNACPLCRSDILS